MIEAVVFDLDGTLVQLPIDYEMLFEEFKRIMRIKEVRPIVDKVSKVDGKTKEVVFKAWDKAELVVLGSVVINEKGMKTYRQFDGKLKALVTLQGKTAVEAILRQLGLVFAQVVTREDALSRVDQLTKAIDHLNIPPRNVLFVGNTDNDAAAAQNVGCQFQRVK